MPVTAELLFARYVPRTLEPKDSIGAKWPRLLDRLADDIKVMVIPSGQGLDLVLPEIQP